MAVEPPNNVEFERCCWCCIHYKSIYYDEDGLWGELQHCEAFPAPEGIPDEIYCNGHFEPRPDLGQKNAIIFEPDTEYIEACRKG